MKTFPCVCFKNKIAVLQIHCVHTGWAVAAARRDVTGADRAAARIVLVAVLAEHQQANGWATLDW